jgi:hypothetical protein
VLRGILSTGKEDITVIRLNRRGNDDRLRLKVRPAARFDGRPLSPSGTRQRAILVASIAPRNDAKLSPLPDREQATSIAEEELDLGFATTFADSVFGNKL